VSNGVAGSRLRSQRRAGGAAGEDRQGWIGRDGPGADDRSGNRAKMPP